MLIFLYYRKMNRVDLAAQHQVMLERLNKKEEDA
jgi:hypothetical protein